MLRVCFFFSRAIFYLFNVHRCCNTVNIGEVALQCTQCTSVLHKKCLAGYTQKYQKSFFFCIHEPLRNSECAHDTNEHQFIPYYKKKIICESSVCPLTLKNKKEKKEMKNKEKKEQKEKEKQDKLDKKSNSGSFSESSTEEGSGKKQKEVFFPALYFFSYVSVLGSKHLR